MGHLLDGHTARPTTGGKPAQIVAAGEDGPRGLSTYRDMPAFGLLQHAAEQVPNRTAIIYGDLRWTYAKVNHEAVCAAAMLQRLGVQPGDRIGILLPNVPEFMIAANAIWRAGAIAVAISPLMVAEEVSDLIKKTDCRYVVCLDMLSHLVDFEANSNVQTLLVSIRQHLPSLHQIGYLWARRSRTGHWTLPTTDRCHWFWDEIKKTQGRWQPISIDSAFDPAYILPTGGTTGSPKAVTLSHTNMVANAWQQFQWTGGSFGTEINAGGPAVLPQLRDVSDGHGRSRNGCHVGAASSIQHAAGDSADAATQTDGLSRGPSDAGRDERAIPFASSQH